MSKTDFSKARRLIQPPYTRFEHSSEGQASVDMWSQEIDLKLGLMELSSDGAWLILNAWVLHVLDTATGEIVFKFPVARPYENDEFARLSTVLEPGTTVKDIGGVGSVSIIDDQLLMFRRVYKPALPANRKYYYDVFDMSSIELESKPVLRVEVDRDRRCLAGKFFLRGLQVVDGRLTFLTQEQREGKDSMILSARPSE